MTREEAAKRWEWVIENFNDSSVYLWPDQRQELLASIALLRGPQPDPDTGLVPCGCGGVLELRARPIPWPETYQKGMVTNTKMQYWVFCRKCHWSTMDYLSKELAVQHANRAMGYREAEEND